MHLVQLLPLMLFELKLTSGNRINKYRNRDLLNLQAIFTFPSPHLCKSNSNQAMEIQEPLVSAHMMHRRPDGQSDDYIALISVWLEQNRHH